MSERLTTLRTLLSQEPMESVWELIVAHLQQWPLQDEERPLAFDYARSHLESWPADEKKLDGVQPDHLCWDMATLVKLRDGDLQGLQELRKHPHIRILDASNWQSLEDLELLVGLDFLDSLQLFGCRSLRDTDALKHFKSLRQIYLSKCTALEQLQVSGYLPQMRHADLNACQALKRVDGLAAMAELRSLDLGDCTVLEDIGSVSSLRELRRLNLMRCYMLQDLSSLAALPHLEALDLRDCYGLDLRPDNERMETRSEVATYQQQLRRFYSHTL